MIAARRQVINIASMLSFQGGIRVASYTEAERHRRITRLLANEWAGKGVNVGARSGYFATNNTRESDRTRAAIAMSSPHPGRARDQPSDVGSAAVFLAASASDTGDAIIPVDGGGGWR
jgi:2-deoxy-D-gluconate 3-dehydrogenase